MTAFYSREQTSPDTAGEKPVREQLQKASIDATGKDFTADMKATPAASADTTVNDAEAAARGRSQRKRSHDEAEQDTPSTQSEGRHGRKRSRDNAPETEEAEASVRNSLDVARPTVEADTKTTTSNGVRKSYELKRPGLSTPPEEEIGDLPVEAVASPKSKRTRVGDKVAEETDVSAPTDTGSVSAELGESSKAIDKGSNGDSTEVTSATATESTLNTTTETTTDDKVAKSTSSLPPSSKAFASSGFGAFSGASSSGFGTLGETSKLSSFASSAPEEKLKEAKASTFGGALGATLAFGGSKSSASGFGGTTSGFGSGFGGGGGGSGFGGGGFGATGFGSGGTPKLSSFASQAGGATGDKKKPAKAFGAPTKDDDDEASEGDDGDEAEERLKSPQPHDDGMEKRDERFYAQDLETGEENETTEYTCRAKLYNFVHSDPADPESKKEWKERGLGTLRLNVQNTNFSGTPDLESGETPTAEAGKLKARLLMRADGSHRVVLNTPVRKELKFGSVAGEAPQGGYAFLMGSIDGKPKLELLQLKIRQQFALELYEHIADLQAAM